MPFEPRLTMITLGVEDIARSTGFYEKLGFKKSSASQDSVTFFITNGTVLGLFGMAALAEDAGMENTPVQYRGVSISYNLDDERAVDDAFAHAISCGATATKKPHKTFWGGYSGYFSDPDGHLWEVAHNPFAPLDENRNMPLPE